MSGEGLTLEGAYQEAKEDFPKLPSELKPEQLDVFRHLMSGKDTAAVLPTGFGKSLLFVVFPLLRAKVSLFYCYVHIAKLFILMLNRHILNIYH
jgi:hypothetical protein